ncbi:MAG: translation initiation factor IF-2 [Acidobacteriota bacterium]
MPILPEEFKKITITEGVTVKELSEKMELKAKDIIARLMLKGFLATINKSLDVEAATELCREFGYEATVMSFEEEVAQEEAVESVPANLRKRDPVVTIMGHVDHGKTSLLDAIRSSKITESEKGGITQHIGAYHIQFKNRGIAFIDTPGHEAFTKMRARGARVTDIVVLVVAADDGVMPQTVEAIDHARAAGVPIVVAINKVDKPNSDLDRVKKQLSERDLLVEDWGGQTVAVPISAKQKTGINELLDMLLLVADMGEHKADPSCLASGTVLESKLDRARGSVATILVQRGTLKVGAPFIAGAVHGKVRAMFDDQGHKMKEAGPSIPVEVIGLDGIPKAGDLFQVLEAEWKVRQIGAFRQQKLRRELLAKSSRRTLDHLHLDIKEGSIKELPLVVKADVQGSVEAVSKTLTDLPSDKVKLKVIHSGVGAVTETDVLLASASNAIIVAYNVRPERSAQELADKEKVDIRLHSVIYDITDEITKAMVGLLEPESKEVYLGRAEVRQVFKVPKIGAVAGCHVSDGVMKRSAETRLLRDNVVVYTGKVDSLRRFKDDASEVKAGYECGIGLANFNDVKVGDVIEAFRIEKIAVKSL